MNRTRVRWRRVGVLALAGALGVGVLAGSATARPTRPVGRVYVVRPGDTLWGIARHVVGPEGDPRPLVDDLVRLNHVRDAVIRPGDRLVVPATY